MSSATVVPEDVLVSNQAEVVLASGRRVRVHGIKVAGLARVVKAIRQSGVSGLPLGLSIHELLTPEQRAELESAPPLERPRLLAEYQAMLTPEQRLLLKQSLQQQIDAMFEWVLASEQLVPVLIAATSDVSEAECVDLDLRDVFDILAKAIDLVDWEATVEAALGFFARIGGLMGQLGRGQAKPAGGG